MKDHDFNNLDLKQIFGAGNKLSPMAIASLIDRKRRKEGGLLSFEAKLLKSKFKHFCPTWA